MNSATQQQDINCDQAHLLDQDSYLDQNFSQLSVDERDNGKIPEQMYEPEDVYNSTKNDIPFA